MLIELFSSHAVLELGHNIFPLLALALDIPEDFFSDKVVLFYSCFSSLHRTHARGQTRNSAALLRILHYPSQPPQTDSSEGSLGIGAHTE
jgi:isopenicillin N synthase-like dioxygenase